MRELTVARARSEGLTVGEWLARAIDYSANAIPAPDRVTQRFDLIEGRLDKLETIVKGMPQRPGAGNELEQRILVLERLMTHRRSR